MDKRKLAGILAEKAKLGEIQSNKSGAPTITAIAPPSTPGLPKLPHISTKTYDPMAALAKFNRIKKLITPKF